MILVNECGDISKGIISTGDLFDKQLENKSSNSERKAGDLGNITVESNGTGRIRLEVVGSFEVWDIIGRALVVDEGKSGQVINPLISNEKY